MAARVFCRRLAPALVPARPLAARCGIRCGTSQRHPDAATAPPLRSVCVDNLPGDLKQHELEALFSNRFGKVLKTSPLARSRVHAQAGLEPPNALFAFVHFEESEVARRAAAQGKLFCRARSVRIFPKLVGERDARVAKAIEAAKTARAAKTAAAAAPTKVEQDTQDGFRADLHYQEPPRSGRFSGRYVNQPDLGDAIDELTPRSTLIHNARDLQWPPTLETKGFELKRWPTQFTQWENARRVNDEYYEEVRELVKWVSGCSSVLVFDHSIREVRRPVSRRMGGMASMSMASMPGRKAYRNPVERVHSDYTNDGAPRRLENFAKEGFYSQFAKRDLTQAEVMKLAEHRYTFINVWRPIDDRPVERKPLALCDTATVPAEDQFVYQIRFPGFKAQNSMLRYNPAHKWYYFPKQTRDECLVFKVFDTKETGPRSVFYTTFDDPTTTIRSPSRRIMVVRTVAFFDTSAEYDGTSWGIDSVADGGVDFFDIDKDEMGAL